MPIKEESPNQKPNNIPISNHDLSKKIFNEKSSNISIPNINPSQNFGLNPGVQNSLPNPSIISQNPSIMNPSFVSQNNQANPMMNQNPMMMMMTNMMMANQGQPNAMNQQLMFQQFQEFMKQNPGFMMQQMKMMGNQGTSTTHSTQNLDGHQKNMNLGGNTKGAKSMSMNMLDKEKQMSKKGAKNLNKFREKEIKKTSKIIGKEGVYLTEKKKNRSPKMSPWRRFISCISS